MKKKVISLLLCMVMVFSLGIVPAMADEAVVADLPDENAEIEFSVEIETESEDSIEVIESDEEVIEESQEEETIAKESATVEYDVTFGSMPAGVYTYVEGTPYVEAGSGEAQVQFIYGKEIENLIWAKDDAGTVVEGKDTLSGDVLAFFNELYYQSRPLYDWLASDFRNTEGFEANLGGNLLLTINENGKLSGIVANDGTCNVVGLVTSNITAPTLTVSGATRGQPNLLQSSVTLMGSANCILTTGQGNVIIDSMTLNANEDGVGLTSSKIGGDVFITGTVFVNGIVNWTSRYGNIQPITETAVATIETNGQDIIIGGANVGRMRRTLNFVSNGGDIIVGKNVSTDYGRGAVLAKPETGTLLLSTSGVLDAGTGDVIVGTNDYRVVNIDKIGDIIANNVVIKPTNNGTKITDVSTGLGNIEASGNVEIEIGSINAAGTSNSSIGNISGNDITVVTGNVNGTIGNITAVGKADVTVGSQTGIGEIAGSEVVKNIGEQQEGIDIIASPVSLATVINGESSSIAAYDIEGERYFKLRDIALKLATTTAKFGLDWHDTVDGVVTVTTGRDYVATGKELVPGGAAIANAVPAKLSFYVDSVSVSVEAYVVNGDIYFNIKNLASVLGFEVAVDAKATTIKTEAEVKPFGNMAAAKYTYIDDIPMVDAGSGAAVVQFIYGQKTDNLVWAADVKGIVESGVETITGDVLDFFNEVYLSDVPVTDWLQGLPKDTEGYAGEVANNFQITISTNGKIAALNASSPKTRVTTVLSKAITEDLLVVTGSTRSNPFLQSCITMVGEVNGLSLDKQGDVILDELVIGSDEKGVGLYGSKIGGDVFVAGLVSIDGAIEWNSKMGVITALDKEPGTIETNGQPITINGGSNTGRAQRVLNIISNGGDIKIGTKVTTDQTRGGIIKNPTAPNILTISTSGVIDAGSGDVIIGTDTRDNYGVEIDRIDKIIGNNVVIKPLNYGEPGNVVTSIGTIEAVNNVEIEVGIINTGGVVTSSFSSSSGTVDRVIEVDPKNIDLTGVVLGDITSANGNINIKATKVFGEVGTFTASNGKVTVDFNQIKDIDTIIHTEDDRWVYVDANGDVDETFTGIKHNTYGWWYVEDGVVTFKYNGFGTNENGDWYCEASKVTFKTNDIINGNVKGVSAWWYVVESKVTYGVETVAHNMNGWWFIDKSGKVDFNANTVAHNENGWWIIKNGKVDFNANTVAHNENGWWYIKDGKVDFTYNGLGTNENGTWYIVNGKVDFSFNGTYAGKTIVGGKVK